MNCGVCEHRWCWSCGFPLNHWMHYSGNPGCELLNSYAFGYGTSYSKACMIFLVIVFFLFGVPAFYCSCAGGCIYLLVDCLHRIERRGRCCGRRCCGGRNCAPRNCGMKCLYFFLMLILALIISSVGIAIGSIAFAILIGPVIIAVLLYVLRLFYQWCLRSRTTNSIATDH